MSDNPRALDVSLDSWLLEREREREKNRRTSRESFGSKKDTCLPYLNMQDSSIITMFSESPYWSGCESVTWKKKKNGEFNIFDWQIYIWCIKKILIHNLYNYLRLCFSKYKGILLLFKRNFPKNIINYKLQIKPFTFNIVSSKFIFLCETIYFFKN